MSCEYIIYYSYSVSAAWGLAHFTSTKKNDHLNPSISSATSLEIGSTARRIQRHASGSIDGDVLTGFEDHTTSRLLTNIKTDNYLCPEQISLKTEN